MNSPLLEAQLPLARTPTDTATTRDSDRRPITLFTACALLCVYLIAALCIQLYGTRAFASELGAYSDEPAHYVTGIMVHDYLTHAFPHNPMAFARDFYDRFPK